MTPNGRAVLVTGGVVRVGRAILGCADQTTGPSSAGAGPPARSTSAGPSSAFHATFRIRIPSFNDPNNGAVGWHSTGITNTRSTAVPVRIHPGYLIDPDHVHRWERNPNGGSRIGPYHGVAIETVLPAGIAADGRTPVYIFEAGAYRLVVNDLLM